MIKKRLICSLAMLAAVFMISGYRTEAYGAEQTFVITKKFETTNKDEDGSSQFPTSQTKDEMYYIRKTIERKIIKEEPIQREIITLEGEGFTGDPQHHKPLETIEQDGKIYRLKEFSLFDTLVGKRTKEISTVIPYGGVEFIDTIPNFGDIEAVDEDTRQTVKTDLPYKSHIEVRSYWDNSFSFPLTVGSYDANTYLLGEVEIPKDADLVLYSRDFLQYLGLPEDFYRIMDIQWQGEVYESNGELRRDALATGQKLVKDMEVTYAGTVTFHEIQAQAYNSVYELLPEEGEADTIYTIEATAAYSQESLAAEQEKNSFWKDLFNWIKIHVAMVTICVALIAFLLLFVVILFIRMKRREKERRMLKYCNAVHKDEQWG